MTMPPSDDPAHVNALADKRFLGGLLMGVGGLIALLCGLCALGFSGLAIVTALQMSAQAGQALVFLVIPLIVGGLPTVGGATLFLVGRRMHREGRNP